MSSNAYCILYLHTQCDFQYFPKHVETGGICIIMDHQMSDTEYPKAKFPPRPFFGVEPFIGDEMCEKVSCVITRVYYGLGYNNILYDNVSNPVHIKLCILSWWKRKVLMTKIQDIST